MRGPALPSSFQPPAGASSTPALASVAEPRVLPVDSERHTSTPFPREPRFGQPSAAAAGGSAVPPKPRFVSSALDDLVTYVEEDDDDDDMDIDDAERIASPETITIDDDQPGPERRIEDSPETITIDDDTPAIVTHSTPSGAPAAAAEARKPFSPTIEEMMVPGFGERYMKDLAERERKIEAELSALRLQDRQLTEERESKRQAQLRGWHERREEAETSAVELVEEEDEFDPDLQPLTPEQAAHVADMWDESLDQVEVQCKAKKDTIALTRKDFGTMADTEWLNDNVINAYLHLLVERGESDDSLPSVWIHSTFFYSKFKTNGCVPPGSPFHLVVVRRPNQTD